MLWAQSAISWQMVREGPSPAKVGDTVALHFRAQIPVPYHLYSSRRPAVEANLPTQFHIEKLSGLRPVPGLFEKGQLHTVYDSIFGTQVYYYEKEATFIQRFVVTGSPAEVAGYLQYQYCDEEQCFTFKEEVQAQFAVEGGGAESSATSAKAGGSPASEAKGSPAPISAFSDSLPVVPSLPTVAAAPSASFTGPGGSPGEASLSEQGQGTSLWWTFLKAFLFGLAAVFTPCTFPMIPLTVSYFTKAQEGRKGFPYLALWYAFSVLLIFWLLGLVLTLFFGASAAYNLATNPWLNLLFFAILLAFGLSFLGAFEITLPASWGTATSRYASPRSLAGVFFMALTLVLVSFSCIGPLVGTLMIDMVGGRVWEPLVGMTGFGLAFALPFGLLAGVPQLLHKLPRAGEWMETFKVTLGFIELALALKFLSNADLVWHLGLLDREVYLVLWITLFIFLALYLLGKIPLKGAAPAEIGVGRLLLSMASFALALYLFTGLWGAPLKFFSGLLPPIHEDMGVRLVGSTPTAAGREVCPLPATRKHADKLRKYTPPDFCAFYDIEEAKQYALQVGKPLLIDFTGHTCTNCRQVEASVWSHPEVKALMQREFVLVSLFVDDATPLPAPIVTSTGEKLRTEGDRWLYFEKHQYGVQAQPYYVVTDSSLQPLVPPRGFTLDVQTYKAFLQEGLQNFRKKYNLTKPI